MAETPPSSPEDSEPSKDVAQPTEASESTTLEVIQASFGLDVIPRFFHLLEHAKALVSLYGPHTTYTETEIFTRAPIPRRKTDRPASAKCLANTLAAAQDSIHSAQPRGPAQQDLQLFKLLWEATIDALEEILEHGELDHEAFGWGVFGLSAGYMLPIGGTPTAPYELQDPLLESHKKRLHAALIALPSMISPEHKREEYVTCGAERVSLLTSTRRTIHICSNLLLQHIRRERWSKIRWWHAIAVVERWIGHADVKHKRMDEEDAEEEQFGQGLCGVDGG